MYMAEKRFDGQVVVITGGARGIGKNIARAFGLQGATVVICDIASDNGELAAAELSGSGIRAHYLQIDLLKTGAVAGLVGEIMQRHGRIDVLVNNAKAGQRRNFLEETPENWDMAMNVILQSAFFAAQAVVPAMKQGGGGSIVNICSVLGALCGQAGAESPGYHVAKAGLMHLTRYLAVHAGPHQVRVNCVAPGFIVQDEHQARYRQADNSGYREKAEFCHPVGQVGCSDDVAKAVLYLCDPASTFITGQCLTVDGGLTLQEPSGVVFAYPGNG
jgi:NAD(P)-dependent dehydrogenase (short-subunit alcohol dehydrogenase family)